MTNNEALHILRGLKRYYNDEHYNGFYAGFDVEDNEAIDYAIKALEREPCEDCRNCKRWNECPCGKDGHTNGTSIGYSIGECKDYEPCEDCISRQEPKIGKWVAYDFVRFGDFIGSEKYECSRCHHRVGIFKSNFCPNCGAIMTESEG